MPIALGVPPILLQLKQENLLERAFHDGLFPNLAFRAEALAEEWPANSGTEVFQTRPGLLAPVVTAIAPGQDPQPQAVPYEQWGLSIGQYTGAIDTHMPTSVTAAADLFLRNIHQLGLQAGQSINRIARNNLYTPYASGNTVLIAAATAGDFTIRVASLNGFTDVVIPGTNARPLPVSQTSPLTVRLGTGAVTATVIGFTPDQITDPTGPGTLLLSAALAGNLANRSPVRSVYAPTVVRSAAGLSVDAITAGDILTLQQCINATAVLRQSNVQPHEDGFYHVHISPMANAQVFADPVFQRLNQSLPEHVIYKEGFIGTISGLMFFMNNEVPIFSNSGTRTATGVNAAYSPEIGAETTNELGVNIGRVIVTGKGCLYERYLNEGGYVTEAGTMGKIGEFDIVNNNVAVLTERIRLILRAPMDRLQQMVSAAWSISTGFGAPSDITAPGGTARYRRAVILEHAI
jgi:hypothetical protein